MENWKNIFNTFDIKTDNLTNIQLYELFNIILDIERNVNDTLFDRYGLIKYTINT